MELIKLEIVDSMTFKINENEIIYLFLCKKDSCYYNSFFEYNKTSNKKLEDYIGNIYNIDDNFEYANNHFLNDIKSYKNNNYKTYKKYKNKYINSVIKIQCRL